MNQPTYDLLEDKCSRYCHNNGCTHYAEKYNDNRNEFPIIEKMKNLYAWNIRWLKNNPLGLSYAAMNILLYVILAPTLMTLLLWGAIRKGKG